MRAARRSSTGARGNERPASTSPRHRTSRQAEPEDMTTIERPADTECAAFYAGYVNGVPEGDVVAFLEQQGGEFVGTLGGVDEARGNFRPAPGKWSLKEVLGHVTDAERVFAYRALRFARGDPTPLASFDQDAY